ncbi:MAG TPA: hypothetical protein VFL90_06565 [Methylomirabilota bacterium]|nr:hypothetical protein [Methylomirabilota bacterium]
MALVGVFGGASTIFAGHEMPFYPSYYPQEITLETVAPASAVARMAKNELHAYVGTDLFAGKPAPKGVVPVESFGGWVVVTFNPASRAVADRRLRCTLGLTITASLPGEAPGFRRFPYPVTPLHGDYLHHADLADGARAAAQAATPATIPATLRLRARGRLAQALLGPRRVADDAAWDAVVEEVAPADLAAARMTVTDGWISPPWATQGWFQAWALLAPSIADTAARRRAEDLLARVTAGAERLEDRIARERELVAALGAGCERVVAGYAVRREWLNGDYSAGVENVAADAQAGLDSAIFVRTVKLKDFPWNGWLTLGVPERATAAWNPVAGFTDPVGRLVWAAVGDPALLPEPYGEGWTDNRVRVDSVDTPARPIPVPRDALAPERGTGVLREVGEGKTARARVTYQVVASNFHDGSKTGVADALYPYALAARWSGPDGDPAVARATALAREALVGVKVVRVDSKTLRFGEVAMQYDVPIVDVYLARAGLDPRELAALAPPWSAVPWPALALMEEAVRQGVGAFSQESARRRGVPWLDVVRDARARERLAALLKTLEARAWVPPALQRLVDEREARTRWGALARFAAERGHVLVTNGPYDLHAQSPGRVVLRVVRDFSYPLGVGSWNRYPIPRRAFVTRADVRGDRLEVGLEVERVEHFAREFKVTTEPLGARFTQRDAELPVCRFVAVGPGGTIARAGTVAPTPPGLCAIGLGGLPRPVTVLVAPVLGGNEMDPHVKAVRLE